MKMITELYETAKERMPVSGKQVIGYQQDDEIVVYQAYNKFIAGYAVQHQVLGGSAFSYNRMSWIKPNFLWMMFRCGWAEKENQERVLAIWLKKRDFETILSQAVASAFNPEYNNSREEWKAALEEKEVRLQWDPDHDPFGNKLERRAIQLGLKGKILEAFGKHMVTGIEDITPFVREQKLLLDAGKTAMLQVPVENVYTVSDKAIADNVRIVAP